MPRSCTSRATSRDARRLPPISTESRPTRIVVELKAAAIDVVAEHALARGARVVLADNEVIAPGLDERVLALLGQRVTA